MADDDDLTSPAVDGYLVDLRRGLAGHRHAGRIVDEVEEHLRDAIDARVERGTDLSTAVADAIAAFGPAAVIADAFEEGAPVPTTFTRWSGLLGMLAVLAVLAVPLEAGSRPETADGRDPLLVSGFVALPLLAVGLLGIVVRTRGAYGRARGAAAAALVGLPFALIPLTGGYGLVGAVYAVMVLAGLALVLDKVFAVGALPRPATLLVGASLVALSAMAPTDLEKQSMPYYVGGVLLAAGWTWLQYTLWSERAE
jgi:hypothetical protein